jgi:hypothetical protein
MYINPNLMIDLAYARQRDLLVQAETHRLARQARQAARVTPPRAIHARRSWHLLRPLRAQAQGQP